MLIGHKTLGRRTDLRRLARSATHDVLDVTDWRWTLALNRSWLEEGLRAHQSFLVLARGDIRGTVLEWELQILRRSGYRSDGNLWRPR